MNQRPCRSRKSATGNTQMHIYDNRQSIEIKTSSLLMRWETKDLLLVERIAYVAG